MSANKPKALFMLDDNDDDNYKEDPAVIRARKNLVLAEKVQQEWVEQKRLERAQLWVEAEAERLQKKVKEAEKEQRELEEVELKRLEGVKQQLEEVKRVEQCAVELQGSERVAEQC